MIVYKLDKDINGQELLTNIQNLVNKFRQDEPTKDALLIIKISSVSYDTTSLIPKLEYKEPT